MSNPAVNSDKGVVLTIGLMVQHDRAAIVFPCATDGVGIDRTNQCASAVDAAIHELVPLILPMMSVDCYISFVEAMGMDDGAYPYREDFAPTTHSGSVASDTLPASIGGLACFYEDTADVPVGARMRHSRMTVPGIGESQVDHGRTTSAYDTLIYALANAMGGIGFTPVVLPACTWYRVIAAPAGGIGAPTAVALGRVGMVRTRQYLGSQRKRIRPVG